MMDFDKMWEIVMEIDGRNTPTASIATARELTR